MTNLLKSMTDFSWALSVFGLSQTAKVLQAPARASESFTKAAHALNDQSDGLTGAGTKPGNGQSPYVGTWLCQYYNAVQTVFTGPDTIFPPGGFPLTFVQKPDGSVEGSYPNPPSDKSAILQGTLSNEGRVWKGTFKGVTFGRIVFVMSEDQQHLYGAWTQNEEDGPPQPWFGIRQS